MFPIVQMADGLHQFLTAARVEAGDRLVEDEVLRPQGQHACYRHAAHLAA